MKALQSQQGQSLGFHFLSFSLNPSRDSMTFISEEINSQILGPIYDADADPFEILSIGCDINCEVCLR